jgi:hypothetical protein
MTHVARVIRDIIAHSREPLRGSGDHTEYLHDGHRHAEHGDHCDEH